MNRHTFFIIVRMVAAILLYTIAATSCKKSIFDTPPVTIPQTEGAVTPVGVEQGAATTAIIGVEGGTLQSADGKLKITVPAGAVGESKTFSIQPVSNANIAGFGQAFRLLPHGNHFSKPVSISFVYNTYDLEGTIPEAIGIAYQDDKGVWQGSAGVMDTAAGTLSFSTTHFSDWSLFKSLELFPGSGSVNFNESLDMHVVNYLSDDDLLPLPGDTPKPIASGKNITAKYIREWKVGGGGLIKPSGSTAIYIAPSTMPAKNPVAVSVVLNGPGATQYMLVSNIYIGPEGISFRIDNGPWLQCQVPLGAVLVQDIDNIDGAVSSGNNGQVDAAVSLKWTGYPSAGTNIAWGEKFPWFLYAPPGNTAYQHYMIAGNKVVPSPGGIVFSKYSTIAGRYVMGSFYMEKAGKRTITGTGITWTPVKIEGFFKVKRSTL
ncbi:MAG: hypothetical protein QM668_06455 [Agriterribacter sp.]